MTDSALQAGLGILVIVVGIAVVGFMVANTFFNFGPKRPDGSLEKSFPQATTFLVGLTATVAASKLDSGAPLVVGVVLGVVFAAIGFIAKATGDSLISLFGRALIVLPIAVISFWPAFTDSLAPECTDQPLGWFQPIVVFVVAAAIAVGLLGLFFGTLSRSLNPIRSIFAVAEGLLAFFAAFKIAGFFLSPFGLSLLDVGVGGTVVAVLGIVVLVLACAISPTWVTRVGGLLIIGTNFAVFATAQQACGAPGPGEFMVILGYCVAHLVLAFALAGFVKRKA
jgi:hypothetical protein